MQECVKQAKGRMVNTPSIRMERDSSMCIVIWLLMEGGRLSFREGLMARLISTATGPATNTALVHCRASSGWGMITSID